MASGGEDTEAELRQAEAVVALLTADLALGTPLYVGSSDDMEWAVLELSRQRNELRLEIEALTHAHGSRFLYWRPLRELPEAG